MKKRHKHASVRFPRSRARAGLLPILAVVLGALMLSGCLSSGYTYVSQKNPDNTTLYFKIPSQWSTLGYNDIAQADNGHLTRSQVNEVAQAQGVNWLEAFSAQPSLKAKQINAFGGNTPAGFTYADELNANLHSSYSLSTMRSVILGEDPLAEAPNDVLNYDEFVLNPGGLRGIKMQLDVPQSNGSTVTLEQVTVVDPATDWVYVLSIGCKASCWAPNQGLIEQVVNSWTVKER